MGSSTSPPEGSAHREERLHLLPDMESHDFIRGETAKRDATVREESLDDSLPILQTRIEPISSNDGIGSGEPVTYRVYKRRWFGLLQLTLLNIIVSWDWLTFAPVSSTASQYFSVSEGAINWLSTAFLFAFVASSPVVMYVLNVGGPKPAILAASALILVGNWVRYAGARGDGGNFGAVMFGQILIGLAQPFVLAAPTRYSDLWFTERGRIGATALASLANPFGGALGQLIDPFWADEPNEIPNMVLWVAIISTVATIPSLFIPHAPPTPASHVSTLPKPSLTFATIRTCFSSLSFHLVFWPFSVYVGAFNAISSLLNQILEPYGRSETEAGIAGALLIIVGLVSSAITSPILDRHKRLQLPVLKVCVVIIAAMYLAYIYAPGTGGVGAPYAVAAILGATSFILLPLTLELLVEVTYPLSPEISSTISWNGGQLIGAISIIVMNSLKGASGEPPGSMKRALIFLTVLCWVAIPLPLMLGLFGTAKRKRDEAERLRRETDTN